MTLKLLMHCRACTGFALGAGLAFLGVAHAGHEFPFYPSFYPQEITVEALDAPAAAQRLAKGTLHAYAGGELAAKADLAKIGAVTAFGGLVVATFDRRAPGLADRSARCAKARSLKDALGEGYTWHPYAVTPFHADYLHHADRAEVARGAIAAQGNVPLRARGAAAERLLSSPARANAPADGELEIVDIAALAAQASTRYDGWSGPPWIRQGWFDAYLLLAPAVTDGAEVRTEIEWLERLGRDVRIVRGSFARRLAERLVTAAPPPAPVCRYVLFGPDGAVAAVDAVRADASGACRLELPRLARHASGGGAGRLVFGAVLEGNVANAPIRIVPWQF